MLNAVRLATRRRCEAHARPKDEAVRLWPWYLPQLQSEDTLIIDALKDTLPEIRVERRADPNAAGPEDIRSENHLLLGSGRHRVPGGFANTYLHADTPEEADVLKRLYQAAWNELCRFRQKWTR